MSEHRRKPPQPQGGGRAAARRGGGQSSGRRAAPPRNSSTGSDATASNASAGASSGDAPAYGGRAAARRAAQRGGRRRSGSESVGGGSGRGGGRRGGGAAGGGRGRGRGGDSGPVKKRFIDYPRAGKYGFRRWVPSWKLVTASCLGFMGLMVGAVGIALLMVDIPTAQAASKVQKNVYYWADGKTMVVAGGGELNRQIVPLSQIPQSMQNAVIAAENASFESDSGVDPMGIARAVLKMAQGGETQSGSTITQQFVKNTYLNQEQTLQRKATELLISIKVGLRTSKDDILAGYLNTAYYGRGAYGIQAAARAYYNKDCSDLTPTESAYLAATLNGPNLYDPWGGQGPAATPEKNTKRAVERWQFALRREVETKRMKPEERQKWLAKGFPKPQRPKPATNRAGQIGYLTDLADAYIVAHSKGKITKAQLDKGGYQIHTTFQRDKVDTLAKSVEDVRKANIKPKERKVDEHVQFGGASVEPGTGKIIAIYGGEDALKHYTNNADDTGVQVGSTFKPFVLAAAMEHGKRNPGRSADQGDDERTPVSPESVYDGDNEVTLRDFNGQIWHDKDGSEWRQKNDGGENRGPISLRTAMQFSVNTPYIQLGMDVGTDVVRQEAIKAGLSKGQLASLSPTFSLGTSAPSAIRLAGAYGTFAAKGKQAEPYSVEKVEKDGTAVYKHEEETTQAFDANIANNVTDVLRNVVEHGTGTSAKLDGRPAAGKTGTTDENRSAWFAGYTPQLSTAIGMFRVDPNAKNQEFLSMRGVGGQKTIHGASYPAEIWADYMNKALKGKPVEDFDKPQPIGKKIFGDGASPTPSSTPTTKPTPTHTPTHSPTPSTPTTPTHTPTHSPTPTHTCGPLDLPCKGNGDGNGDGNGPGDTSGPGGHPTATMSPSKPGSIFD
ncbi:transglycosylase domain-containing protein [Streptomyces varsoviensis]|uniref:transglycosylase domain-containing protein n=1 Tax=Streptomyces varsoviensis TaxID=67373 RepID=UPI0004C5749B|nr:transglycosylase domain-containing protein [Streptomyces varsoviensis]